MRNPDVTVRSRGVMEKCTYCVQRINRRGSNRRRATGDQGRRDRHRLQAACPADAIVFGDLNDPTSRVAKLKAQQRDYGLLEDLNTRPRTTYLAALRNPNPELESAPALKLYSLFGEALMDPKPATYVSLPLMSPATRSDRSRTDRRCRSDQAATHRLVRSRLARFLIGMLGMAVTWLLLKDRIGASTSGRLGFAIINSVADRHRQRRDADFRHPPPARAAALLQHAALQHLHHQVNDPATLLFSSTTCIATGQGNGARNTTIHHEAPVATHSCWELIIVATMAMTAKVADTTRLVLGLLVGSSSCGCCDCRQRGASRSIRSSATREPRYINRPCRRG